MPLALRNNKQMQMAFENESKTFLTSENFKCRVEFLNVEYPLNGKAGYIVCIMYLINLSKNRFLKIYRISVALYYNNCFNCLFNIVDRAFVNYISPLLVYLMLKANHFDILSNKLLKCVD